MRLRIWIATLCLPFYAQSQGRIIMYNDPWIVMQGNVVLVVDNANPNAITVSGTGGNIVSEAEGNYVKWTVGAATGDFIVPFSNYAGNKIPLTMSVTTPGMGNGTVGFSTYGIMTWNNNLFKPADVLNMTNMGLTNASAFVIDRFWMTKTSGFTTRPSGTLTFTYLDAEHTAAGNTITESSLRAERYELGTDNWEVYAPAGVINTTNNTVSSVPFTHSDFVIDWTLIDQAAHLLPLTVSEADAYCAGNGEAQLNWTTASELHTQTFIVGVSENGKDYVPVQYIPAAGTSQEMLHYTATVSVNHTPYIQLQCADADGSIYDVQTFYTPCAQTETLFTAWDAGYHHWAWKAQGVPTGNYSLNVIDMTGKLIYNQAMHMDESATASDESDITWANGVFIVVLQHENGSRYVSKMMLRD